MNKSPSGKPGAVQSHLVDAAELQAVLGNRAEVIQLLEQVPQTEDPLINLTEDLMRLTGSETALRLYNEAGGHRPNILLTAASAATDSDRSTAYLEEHTKNFLTKNLGQTSIGWNAL